MKKIVLALLGLVILTGCNRATDIEDTSVNSNSTTLELVETSDCTDEVKEYYNYEERTVYLVCIDEIYIKSDSEKDITLKYYFENVNQGFDASINVLVRDIEDVETLKDGGTKIYKSEDYTIITCNTIEGNRDIYIGDGAMEYKQKYCK